MNDTLEQYAQQPLGDNILAQIAQTARDVMEAQALVAEREEALKDAQKLLRVLQQETLPELMATAGQDALTTIDGLKVAMKTGTQWRPDQDQRKATISWLEDNGHAAIVKREVKLPLGKVSQEEVNALSSTLVGMGLAPAFKLDVHPQTFGALIRELLQNGENVPLADMGAEVTKFAEVKAGK
jgi:hypothetical protein